MLREDPLILKLCPLKENASHHVENSKFGYNLILKSGFPMGFALLLEDPLISENLSHGGECVAP